VYSMTGFGKGECVNDKYKLVVEMKSVNHRFKDMRFRMGSVFSSKELGLRKAIEKKFSRGSFDIAIFYKVVQKEALFDDLDMNKIDLFLGKMKTLADSKNIPLTMRACEFLRSDFVADQETEKEKELSSLLEGAFDSALNALAASRKEEGDNLIEVLNTHRLEYQKHFKVVVGGASEYKKIVEERLTKRLNEKKGELEIDEPRYLQEVIYYLEKLDVHEEIDRIGIHLKKLEALLAQENEKGRQIDFILQELGRETNTIGSKSGQGVISETVIQMKVQLEKMREQALNIE
jgi:uncharacterized protein (TIGR00255 family)